MARFPREAVLYTQMDKIRYWCKLFKRARENKESMSRRCPFCSIWPKTCSMLVCVCM